MSGGSSEHYWSFWAQWYLSNAVGSLALGPIALILLSERPGGCRRLSPDQADEAAVWQPRWSSFAPSRLRRARRPIPSGFLPALVYLPLPFVLWAAVRFGAKGASSAILLVTVILIWRALNGPSLFLAGNAETSVFAIQVFVIGLSVPILLLGASIDETRQAEKVARESEERMAFAAISADVCLWHIDYQSDRFWVTNHGRELLGLGPQEPISRHAVMSVIHPDDRQRRWRRCYRAAAKAWPTGVPNCPARDGEIRWIRCRARAHRKYRGAPAEISGTFADITDLKICRERARPAAPGDYAPVAGVDARRAVGRNCARNHSAAFRDPVERRSRKDPAQPGHARHQRGGGNPRRHHRREQPRRRSHPSTPRPAEEKRGQVRARRYQ